MSLDIFQKCIQELIDSDRFYAGMIQQCRRVFTDKIPTAAVSMNTSMTLMINPEWMKTWTVEFGTKVLKHEMAHLLLGHITRVKSYPDYKLNMPFYNICMDLAVNSLIDFPNSYNGMEFCTIDNYAKKKINLKPKMPFDYYVETLKQKMEKVEVGYEIVDDHGQFGDGDNEADGGTPQEVTDQTLRHAVRQAYQMAKDAGNIPGELQALIDSVVKTVSINNWRRELRNFPQDCEVVDFESTRNRRNRRYGFLYPGTRPVRSAHLGLGFDVSGSMWDPATIATLQNEVNEILKSGCKLTVMLFDTRITAEYEVSDKLDLNGVHKAIGGGGTDFGPVFERAKALQLDGMIMATDGEAGLNLSYAKPTIWAIYEKTRAENFKAVAPFGKVLHIEASS